MIVRRSYTAPDTVAVALLVALWLWFFWRLFTPIAADQASLEQGDFSGQFVAFGAYQYQRFASGEVPLWNPYNNGGLPFIADTQAAVFYPPRLITIFLSKLAGGWSYHALELEMTAHVLAYSLGMYLLVRRLTWGQSGSVFGGFVAAAVASYGGYLTGYPPLQLALLEAGVWLPLALLGVLEATRHKRPTWAWLLLAGAALGLSWMAGHPQTSWFLTYLLVAYLAYRSYAQQYRWTAFVAGAALMGLLAGGMAAVQLLPGIEYLARAIRFNYGYDAKSNGFPLHDIVQFIFPHIVSQWSPLYAGLVGLVLAILAVWRRLPGSLFVGGVALLALGLSFGANSAVFPLLYNLLPGLRYFRGQERAVYLVANSLAILAGLGAAHLATWDRLQDFKATQRIRQGLLVLLLACGVVTALGLMLWLILPDDFSPIIRSMALSTLVAALTFLVLPWVLANPPQRVRPALLAGVVIFELFTANLDNIHNFDPVPPQEQLSMAPPPLVAEVLEDRDTPFRVDGFRGLHDNFGSLYGLMDMRGISPLFLAGPYTLIESDKINPLAWELFAVRYVFTDWQQMPVPSEVIASGLDRYGPINLHRLSDPRPFALLLYDVEVLDSDEFAYALLRDSRFSPRRRVILNRDPGIPLHRAMPEQATAMVTEFLPETFSIQVQTTTPAVLSVSHPDYPGWQATVDGQPVDILRAYGALAAVIVPAGGHTVRFMYDPLSYRIGVILSMVSWSGLGILLIMLLVRRRSVQAKGV